MRRELFVAIAGLAVLEGAVTASAEALDRHLLELDIVVDEPGFVLARLDPGAFAGSSPAGEGRLWPAGVHLHGPDGARVESAVLVRAPAGPRTPRTVSVERHAKGWTLVLDTGPVPSRHARIRVRSAREFSAKGCVVESSHDRESWSRLAQGDLFRLGDRADLERTELEYSETTSRYLRLTWPESAGFPEFRELTVVTEATPLEKLPSVMAPLDRISLSGAHEDDLTFEVELPVAGLDVRALELPTASGSAIGYRLFDRFGPGARILAQGIAAPGLDPQLRLLFLSGEELPSRRLRLTLHGVAGGVDPPRELRLFHEPMWLLFEANESGPFVVALSSDPAVTASSAWPLPPRFAEAWPVRAGTPGASRKIEAHDVPEEVTTAHPVERRTRPGRRWLVSAGEDGRGRVVRLPLVGEVLQATEGNLGTLRLIHDRASLPYCRRPSAEATLVPLVAERDGENSDRIEIVQPPEAPRMEAIELLGHGEVFTASVTLEQLISSRPGVEPRRTRIATRRWTCDERPPLPCHTTIDTGKVDWPARFELRLSREPDGLMPAVTLQAWASHDELVFLMPSDGRVTLESGFPGRETPFPGLAEILVTRGLEPSTEARLTSMDFSDDSGASRRPARWLLVAALVLVGAALLISLGRTLTRRE